MVKYLLFALFVLISLAYVMSAPASNEEPVEIASPVDNTETEDVQPTGSRKAKRGIYGGYGGYGFGHYPYLYGGYGHGYGYGHYPFYHGLGYGYGHGYGGFGHGYFY